MTVGAIGATLVAAGVGTAAFGISSMVSTCKHSNTLKERTARLAGQFFWWLNTAMLSGILLKTGFYLLKATPSSSIDLVAAEPFYR